MGLLRRRARGISPALLVLAALFFLLPFVGVSCNSSAAQGMMGGALSQLGGSSSAGDVTGCLSGLNNRDLVSYSGVSLAFGRSPSTVTDIPGCTSPSTGSTALTPSASNGDIGVQPLVLIALLVIIAGALTALVRTPMRHLAAAGAATVAGVLLLASSATIHSAVLARLSSSSSGQLSGLSGAALDGFFSVHPSFGFWLTMLALLLALGVNTALLLDARRAQPAAAVASTDTGTPPPPPPLPAPGAPSPTV